nr:MAG: hypothetical protein 2 [Dicistroviridae sp.]
MLQAYVPWKATERDAVLLKTVRLPADWLQHEMFQEKLSGFRYFKADFKIRLQVNAQPFNAGLLLMVYLPFEESMTETPSSQLDFSGLTGYRHVLLDLSQDTACELTVPWSPMVSHMDLLKAYGALGSVKLYVYSPLTGSDDVDGTIWITAENVEVALPTGIQMEKVVHGGPAHSGGDHGMKGRAAPKTAKDQAGTTKPPRKPRGAVSSIASTVGSVAGALKDVPVIGPIASTVEWVGGAVSDVLDFFGFSKPADTSLPSKQTLVVGNNFANYDGDSKVKSLAFSWANEVQIPTEVFQETDDEMSFNHILARPTYLTRFKMLATSAQNSVIWKWPVDPRACDKVLHQDSSKAPFIPGRYLCANTYLSYLSNFFKFYRGTLNYHFRIVKTVFHSGRIRVFVVPGANVDTDVATIDFSKVHSSVYDIRDTNQFDISVPYKWNAPWKAVDGVFGALTQTLANRTPNEPTAMIYVVVINSLRNPSTAEGSIDFVVETSAGDDFQFACPIVSRGCSLVTTGEQLRIDYPADVRYQGVDVAEGPAHSADTMLDNAGGDQITANKVAIGEVVTGWRALLKRYSRWLVPVKSGDLFVVRPYTSAISGSIKDQFDFYAAAELMYRFVSGGLRLGMKVPGATPAELVITHELEPYNSLDAAADTSATVLQSSLLEPLVELGIPFYQPTLGILTAVGRPKESYASEPGTAYQEMPYNTGTIVRSSARTQVWRTTAEDFSFGYLLGPPQTLDSVQSSGVECKDHWSANLDGVYQTSVEYVKSPQFRIMLKTMMREYMVDRPETFYFKVVHPGELPDELAVIQTEFAKYVAKFDAEPDKAKCVPIVLDAMKYAHGAMVEYFGSVCLK